MNVGVAPFYLQSVGKCSDCGLFRRQRRKSSRCTEVRASCEIFRAENGISLMKGLGLDTDLMRNFGGSLPVKVDPEVTAVQNASKGKRGN